MKNKIVFIAPFKTPTEKIRNLWKKILHSNLELNVVDSLNDCLELYNTSKKSAFIFDNVDTARKFKNALIKRNIECSHLLVIFSTDFFIRNYENN